MSDRLQHLDLAAAGEPYRAAHDGNSINYDGITGYTSTNNFPQINTNTPFTAFFADTQRSFFSTVYTVSLSNPGQWNGVYISDIQVSFYKLGNSPTGAGRWEFLATNLPPLISSQKKQVMVGLFFFF